MALPGPSREIEAPEPVIEPLRVPERDAPEPAPPAPDSPRGPEKVPA